MNNIGQKIKELRKKNDLTQEKLADLLGVTYQSVSKWECGVTSPDLALIGPLTKVLHVTSDELLGLTKPVVDARRAELEEACRKAWIDGGGERDNFRMIYDAQEALVREFPDDMKYLCDFAWTVSNRAWNFEDREVFRAEQERAVRYFETVIETTDDERVKCIAVDGITSVLGYLGRQEEAKAYVELLPETPYRTKEQIFEKCLHGEELRKHYQQKLDSLLRNILIWVVKSSSDSNKMQAVTLAEDTLMHFFKDQNYLGFQEAMYNIQRQKAVLLIGEKRYDEAVRAMQIWKKHAVLADELEGCAEVQRYTSPYFDLLETEPCTNERSGNPTHEEAFLLYLEETLFDPLRDRADFQALLA